VKVAGDCCGGQGYGGVVVEGGGAGCTAVDAVRAAGHRTAAGACLADRQSEKRGGRDNEHILPTIRISSDQVAGSGLEGYIATIGRDGRGNRLIVP